MNLPRPWTAASTLALIGSDPGVRAIYLASYQGTEDGLAALALVAAAEEGTDAKSAAASASELRRLQDLAYGRPTVSANDPEREQAAQHLAAISADENRRRVDVYTALSRVRDALDRGTQAPPLQPHPSEFGEGHARDAPDAPSTEPGPEPEPEPADAPATSRLTAIARASVPARFLLIASLTAGIIIGVGLGLASAIGFERPLGTPTAPATSLAAVGAPFDLLSLNRFPGNLTAADTWFARPQNDVDIFNGFIIFQGDRVAASASRFAGTTASGWKIWVAQTPSRGFCLIGRRDEGPNRESSAQRECVSRTEFEKSSVRIELDATTVVWNGKAILTSIRW